MSSITTSIFTYMNSCENKSKKSETEKTEIIFKKKNISTRSISLLRTLTIDIKPSGEKMTLNPNILSEEIKQIEIQKQKDKDLDFDINIEKDNEGLKPLLLNEMKSILKNNKFNSSVSLKEFRKKSVKFIDELPEKENEENENKKENNTSFKNVDSNLYDFNNEININTEKDTKKTSNRQLAEIIYIPSLRNCKTMINNINNISVSKEKNNKNNKKNKNDKNDKIKNIQTNNSNSVKKKKNNLEEDKVTTKCCLIF
jgi:hypothetical protein